MRQERSLDGQWQFQLDPDGAVTTPPTTYERQIQVPLPWQAAFQDLGRYSGFAWYRREIELADEWLTGDLLLHFGAVDYWCQLFVNGQLAGEHEGGYTHFSFSIREYAKAGTNEIALRVYDTCQTGTETPRWPEFPEVSSHAQPPFSSNEIPHGKQEWYENVGGIWQSVTLSAVPALYIKRVAITPHNSGLAEVKIDLVGDATAASGQLAVTLTDRNGQIAGRASAALADGQSSYTTSVQVDNPRLWEIGASYLYGAEVLLNADSPGEDTWTGRFGFREITTRDGLFLLNDKPFFLLGALDQDMYEHTIYTVPSREYLADQFKKAQELGLNTLRCHIKPPDPVYLELADEMGLLVWAEIPSWRSHFHKGTYHANQMNIDDLLKARVENTLREMVDRDFNHPSLIIWTMVNEDWGTALPLRQEDRTWVGDLYALSKQLDPTRLAVDNSACPVIWGSNLHVHSDIDDFHTYHNIPDYAGSYDRMMDAFNLRPLWNYSSHGDAVRTGHEPLVLSEFGNWGLPSLKGLQNEDGSDPYWFFMGPWWSDWGGEPGWPKGVLERFKRFGLEKVWPDYEAFATASQWHQYQAMKYEIESMRRQPHFSGYVITEMSDIYWESNGLLDFKRQPKVYHDIFGTVNNPDVLIALPESYSAWSGQTVNVNLLTSHYSQADWSNPKLTWTAGNNGIAPAPVTLAVQQSAQVAKLEAVSLQLPPVEKTGLVKYTLQVEDGQANRLAYNELDILTLPESAHQAAYAGRVSVIETGKGSFASVLSGLGYQVGEGLGADTELAVATTATSKLLAWVRQGGDLLFLADGPGPFFWTQGRGDPYGGNWISSYSWLKPGAYSRLDGVESPVSLTFREIIPANTLLGLPIEQDAYQDDFLAGQVTGWIQHPAVHTVQFRFGQGRVIMTTFNLEKAIKDKADPVGIAMFHDLVDHLKSDACDPKLKGNY